jgi:hypothetical protein
LHKGRRFWVAENNREKPVDGWTGDYKLIAYDRLFDALAAVGNWKPDGTIEAEVVSHVSFGVFHASDLKDLVRRIAGIDRLLQAGT